MTLADVALLAGVNKSTVSRALRDCSHVGSATKEKVLRAAAELDYRPDPTIARLAAQRWRSDGGGRVDSLTLLFHSRSPRFHGMLRFAQELCEKYGYSADVVYVADFVSPDSLLRSLEFRGVERILLFGFEEGSSLDPRLPQRFSIVNCGSILDQPICSVDLDWRRMLDRAVKHLSKRGCQRVGLALSGAGERESRILRQRFDELFADDYRAVPVMSGEASEDAGALLSWYRAYAPDGVVGFGPEVGRVLQKRMPEWGAYLSLQTEDLAACDQARGFCCGERLVVERGIQLLQLERLPGSQSRMELHHIVPEWRLPADDEAPACEACLR
ncbi:LacI family DNA-binding transcriptional regulator [Pelagicoccus sp. SDUM812005]|uniref:LacI family DNA-binding transcriptional regulator n=1 Tax=Pelagicoccus sp. SDUM812005 TaxID=3041257 RepID=UPI00280EF1F1|nr:LacI family DNA-binding transcriptional regulator [Pelagicoccus sp. SDUM812005]MDQ8182842.1 LacI family DNA-binding transcriptional regulator [Pelagicoccus sp. SDUM812005]